MTEQIDRAIGDYSRNYDLRRYGGDDEPRWLPDGTGLLLLINEAGTVQASISFRIADGTLTPLTNGDQVVTAFSIDPTARTVVALIGDSQNPGDLFLIEEAGQVRRLTEVNRELLREVEVAPSLRFDCASGDVQMRAGSARRLAISRASATR